MPKGGIAKVSDEKINHLCEQCNYYFDYYSIYITEENGKEVSTKNHFSSCLKYGNGFQIQSYSVKNLTQSCSQFDKKRTY